MLLLLCLRKASLGYVKEECIFLSLASSEDVYAIRWAAGKATRLPPETFAGNPGTVLRISSDGNDRMGAKIKTQKNP